MRGAIVLMIVGVLGADAGVKHEAFDADPGWEGYRNRAESKRPPAEQDFGYSATHFAGKAAGEIGGKVTRSTRPAYYAAKIEPRTLDDRLSASGSFAITSTTGGGGLFFGWFQSVQPGSSGRPIGSFGLDFGSERSGGRLAIRMINGSNTSKGATVTVREKKNKETSIRNDGTKYHWTLDYDPAAADGNGRFTFVIRSDAAEHEDFEGKPITADLPPGFKQQGATFDRFGMMNMLKSGGAVKVYFDDVEHDGRREDFAKDPAWTGWENRGKFEETDVAGRQDFGYSGATRFAGASTGEIGGSFWRTGKNWGYYADRIGPLTLEQRIEARGRVMMVVGGVDASMCLGFFSGARQSGDPPDHAGDFLGVRVGGPTRVGHYFMPIYATSKGTTGHLKQAPIVSPGKAYDWSLVYDPAAEGGLGAITVKLGEETVTLPLKKGQRAEGGTFDRFGMLSTYPGGQMVKIYLDDLSYSTGR